MTDKENIFCPHCGSSTCITAETMRDGWTISCGTETTYNIDGSYTTHPGQEHKFAGYVMERNLGLVEEVAHLEQQLQAEKEEREARVQELVDTQNHLENALLRCGDPDHLSRALSRQLDEARTEISKLREGVCLTSEQWNQERIEFAEAYAKPLRSEIEKLKAQVEVLQSVASDSTKLSQILETIQRKLNSL
ncbi:MAG: hypothetical protein WC505_05860 [Patescibacteria group bacterium]